jgi:hypothetical protein
MAKHDTDPVLQHLIHAVNESGPAGVPMTIVAHGMALTGLLIAQEAYFTELAAGQPMMSALQPSADLLGKEYGKEVEAESGYHLHLRGGRVSGDGEDGLWRVSLQAVDAWTLRPSASDSDAARDDSGPFARLLGA